jgi:hypothetical protein
MITAQPVKLSSAEIWTVSSAKERRKGLEGAAVERMVAKGKGNAKITNEEEEKERTLGVTESVPRPYPSFFRKLYCYVCSQ